MVAVAYSIFSELSFHFQLPKNLITAVSVFGLTTNIYISYFIFWNGSHNFLGREKKNVNEIKAIQ